VYHKENDRQDNNTEHGYKGKNSCIIPRHCLKKQCGFVPLFYDLEAFMQDKRKHSRIQKKVKSEVAGKDHLSYSSSLDLSAGGMFISTPDPVAPGSEIDLSIKLSDGEIISLKGIVRWTKDEDSDESRAGMGIEFTNLTPEAETKIRTHL
jgi:uncharacterized protein (TIGR02266 family)